MIHTPRARDLGIPFESTPGPWNAITDVDGVEVGYTTLIEGEGPLVVGRGPVRTGVTVVLPRGKADHEPVLCSYFAFNGMGEVSGALAVAESGRLYGPLAITNTHSTGTVRDALVAWSVREGVPGAYHLPLVGETFDGYLNDINGLHVRPDHAYAAIEGAASGPVAEGNVGGGTGMIMHGFKGQASGPGHGASGEHRARDVRGHLRSLLDGLAPGVGAPGGTGVRRFEAPAHGPRSGRGLQGGSGCLEHDPVVDLSGDGRGHRGSYRQCARGRPTT